VRTGDIIAGRDVNFGLTPEQVKELTEAAARGATGPLTSAIVDLSKRLGITEDATRTLLRIVGEQDVPLERLSETLNRVANDYKRLQGQAAALNPDNPTAKALVEQAKPEIEAGHFGRARELLRQATQAQIAAAQQAYQIQEQARAAGDAQMLGAAQSTSAEADVALTERRYLEAADLFSQAAGYVPSGHTGEHGGYLLRQADALYRQGDERGDNAALQSSIEVYGRALVDYPRERVPLDWARTQMNLGTALFTLGERESGTGRLAEAVAAYRAALEERTRERVPLDWATTESNLGNALATLGERESGTGRLAEAVAAYRAALEERTRERVPLDWAKTQHGLANALAALAERQNSAMLMEEAIKSMSEAVEVYQQAGEGHWLPIAQKRVKKMQAELAELKR
jgi:hypothetical protein